MNYEPMPEAEVLARAEAFDPLPTVAEMTGSCPDAPPSSTRQAAIMRLALEMIVAQCRRYDLDLDTIQRTAEQALRECA